MSFGLDIGSKTIKLIELSKEGKSWHLKASGIVGHSGKPPEFVKDNKEFTPLVEAIRKLVKEAKVSSRDVVIALPETHVFVRTVRFPLLTDSEVASAVKWEAEQYIPIPVKDAIIQHKVVERREDLTPPQVIVLLVAAPRMLVDKYSRVIEMSGLRLVAVETELMALVRSLAPRDQTSMVVDFGAQSTDIAISRSGQLVFSRSINTAGDTFTRAVSQSLGIDESQAEQYKRTYGLSITKLEGKVKAAIDPYFSIVADEMKKAVHFFQTEEKGELPKSVILSGGSAAMVEATSELAKTLGVEVVVGNPFSGINIDPEAVKKLVDYAPLYSISVGLALREG